MELSTSCNLRAYISLAMGADTGWHWHVRVGMGVHAGACVCVGAVTRTGGDRCTHVCACVHVRGRIGLCVGRCGCRCGCWGVQAEGCSQVWAYV